MDSLRKAFIQFYKDREPTQTGNLQLYITGRNFAYDDEGIQLQFQSEHYLKNETGYLVSKWEWFVDSDVKIHIFKIEGKLPHKQLECKLLKTEFEFEFNKLKCGQLAKVQMSQHRIQLGNFVPTVIQSLEPTNPAEQIVNNLDYKMDVEALQYDIDILRTMKPNHIIKNLIRKNKRRIQRLNNLCPSLKRSKSISISKASLSPSC